MRVLVTGAGGYVGSAVVRALATAGHDPVAMGHHETARIPAGVEVRTADLLDPKSLVSAVADVDAVCHLAALALARESWECPLDYFAVNVGGTVESLRAMHSAGVVRLVFASTASIYGSSAPQPMSEELPDVAPHPYASSKQAAEAAIGWETRRSQLSVAVLRLFNVAGGADPDATRIIPRLLAAAAGENRNFVVNGDGSTVRDFLHVDDAAEAFTAALKHGPPQGVVRRYNVGSGVGTSVMDVVAAAERVIGQSIPVVHNPPAFEPPVLVCDSARTHAELRWKPRRSDLETIVRDAWVTYS
jgi:UDP-glucose 4-epimerase